MVKDIRKIQPRLGTRKLHYKLEQKGVKIGRDQLGRLLKANGLILRQRKKHRPASTDGDGNSIYPDLRKGMEVLDINQLWSSDITYLELEQAGPFCYCTLVVDEKSHLIVGYHLARNMTAKETLKALEMAVASQVAAEGHFNHRLIFHSDRGSQFKSGLFWQYQKDKKIRRSMCEQGKSSENPVAERLNGILKHELLIEERFRDFAHAQEALARAIHIYNEQRPHLSCDYLTPQEAHQPGLGPLKKRWTGRKARKPVEHA